MAPAASPSVAFTKITPPAASNKRLPRGRHFQYRQKNQLWPRPITPSFLQSPFPSSLPICPLSLSLLVSTRPHSQSSSSICPPLSQSLSLPQCLLPLSPLFHRPHLEYPVSPFPVHMSPYPHSSLTRFIKKKYLTINSDNGFVHQPTTHTTSLISTSY